LGVPPPVSKAACQGRYFRSSAIAPASSPPAKLSAAVAAFGAAPIANAVKVYFN